MLRGLSEKSWYKSIGMRSKYYILLGVLGVVIVAAILVLKNQNSGMKQFAAGRPITAVYGEEVAQPGGNTTSRVPPPAQFCPGPEMLVKDNTQWGTADKKWESYTPSSATNITNFIGAQWVGIKVGKVICLYQSNEAVSFPVALEQARSQLISEPKGVSWSALVGNRRLCKSSSVADCSYFVEASKDLSNVYQEIEYAPEKRGDE